MKKSTRAVLLSAFICPGAGHFFLKKYISAGVFIGVFICALGFFISDVITITEQVMAQLTAQINAGNIGLDITALIPFLTAKLQAFENQHLAQISYLLMILWLVAIVDSYRAGRAADQHDEVSNKATG